jgi:pyruvate ferredoxin oxidoreductase gamma subunit
LINSRKPPEALGLHDAVKRLPAGNVVCVPATELALRHLKMPKPNTALVGAATAMRPDLFDEIALTRAIAEVFPGRVGELNVAAAREAIALVTRIRSARAEEAAPC